MRILLTRAAGFIGSHLSHVLVDRGDDGPRFPRCKSPRRPDMAPLMVAKATLANIQLGDMPAIFADASALDRWTEFHPATSIDAGLGRFVAWYRRYFSA